MLTIYELLYSSALGIPESFKLWLESSVARTPYNISIQQPQGMFSSSSSSVDRWTQVVDLYVQSVVYHSEYRTIRIQ